jgi:hypothetical protein
VRGVTTCPAGEPADPILGPVQPVSVAEGGPDLARPAPGFDGRRAIQEVEIVLQRGVVGRQAQYPASELHRQPGDAGIPRHAQRSRRCGQLASRRLSALGVAQQQRQPRGQELMPEGQAPAEDEITGQQLPGFGEPRLGAIRVTSIQTQVSEVLKGGDG